MADSSTDPPTDPVPAPLSPLVENSTSQTLTYAGQQVPEAEDLGIQTKAAAHDPYVALRNPNYRRYFIGNLCSLIGTQMAGVTVGWELYARSNSPMALGMIGLVQVIPIIALALPSGHMVDRLNRKMLILLASMGMILSATLMGVSSRFAAEVGVEAHRGLTGAVNGVLAGMSTFFGERQARFDDPHIPILFLLLLCNGVLRAVNQPAKQSVMPMLVPAAHFPNAVTWNASLFEMSNVVGPMIAGFAIAAFHPEGAKVTWGYAAIYWANAACQLVQLVNIAMIRLTEPPRVREPTTMRTLFAGVHFVFQSPVIIGAITLDMFAVLLGGATALLPVFAKDILHVGPVGLGWLRAAPSLGALTTAIVLAHMPPMQRAGRNLLWAVAGFGIATIVFGLSRMFWLSMAALILAGMFDNISVVVRHSLVQLRTPDAMRGRVNAVNSVFISSSNELGAFESGVTAALGIRFFGQFLGPMIAVAAGGGGTILVVLLVAWLWPQLASVKRLEKH